MANEKQIDLEKEVTQSEPQGTETPVDEAHSPIVKEGASKEAVEKIESEGQRIFPKAVNAIYVSFTVLAIFFAIKYLFSLGIGGFYLTQWQYFYLLIAAIFPFVFLLLPASKKSNRIMWFDYLFAVLGCVIPFYFALNMKRIEMGIWSFNPPTHCYIMALIFTLLVLEGARRSAGLIFTGVALVLGLFPMYAPFLPGIFKGAPMNFKVMVGFLAFDAEGYLGTATAVLGGVLIGFLLFAAMLVETGASDFFLNLAMCLGGKSRGGMAKVSVLGSAFFGSLSGSVFANIVGTGSLTIPGMKKAGYPGYYAGAVEACASTGGVLMPPVMGAVAFVMATMTQIPYGTILVAAIVPSCLYYFGIFVQVDGYAAKHNMKGLPPEECPRFLPTFKSGWYLIFVLAFLVWGLVVMRWEARTPFFACALLFVLCLFSKERRVTPKKALQIILSTGRMFVTTIGVLLPIGLVINGLLITGGAPAFTAGIIAISHGSTFIALLLGAVACYILGMAGMVTAAYMFLAMTLAPAVVGAGGLNVLAVHMFIIYYSMLASITPPVASGSFLAANIAGANQMKCAWQSMRLAVVIYLIPFFFVYEPALIFQGGVGLLTIMHVGTAIFGVWVLASSIEGYLAGAGTLTMPFRIGLAVGGLSMAAPLPTIATVVAIAATCGGIFAARTMNRKALSTPA